MIIGRQNCTHEDFYLPSHNTWELSDACSPHQGRAWHTGPGTAWLDNTFDLVLSSGFLAFANHSGFLKAVSEAEINVGGVMGTSAGALSGSLYSAGYSPRQVAFPSPPVRKI